MLIPTLILLLAFIAIRSLKKGNPKVREFVDKFHVLIILILAILIFSAIFGGRIAGYFTAEKGQINSASDISPDFETGGKSTIITYGFLLVVAAVGGFFIVRRGKKKSSLDENLKKMVMMPSPLEKQQPRIEIYDVEKPQKSEVGQLSEIAKGGTVLEQPKQPPKPNEIVVTPYYEDAEPVETFQPIGSQPSPKGDILNEIKELYR